jgi:DNA-directed RNA polymerase specialized sigma24 family protein
VGILDLDVHLGQIAAGDPDAFARWVAGAEPTLRESLRSFAALVDTEAVLQEVLLRLWQVAPRVEPDGKPNSLFRLGIRIARNLAVSERRRLHGEPLEDEEGQPGQADLELRGTPDPMLRARIRECHDKLPAKPQEALAARLASGGGEADEVLAARLSMRVNTFLQNFTRARRLLAECLKASGVDLGAELA